MNQLPLASEQAQPRLLTEFSPALPLVNLSVSLLAGSTLDPAGKDGLAEMLVRLMRRNAKGREASENDRILDTIGASLGADVVPSSMGFHGTVISRCFQQFTDLLADTVSHPGFREDELERLKREMHGELVESLDNDRALARRWFRRTLFEGHAYGRPSSGTPTSLAAITLDDIETLYKTAFVKNGLVFAFAGDVNSDSALESTLKIGGELHEGDALDTSVSDPRPPQGRRLLIVDKPERTQTQILVGGLGTHPLDSDHTALHVANTIFGGTFTARLTQEVRAKRGWSYGAYSSLPFDRSRHAFSMWTFPKAEDAAACLALELSLLEAWCEHGVTEDELEGAKRYLGRSHAFAVDTAAKRVGQKLDAVMYQLPPRYYEDYVARVQAVTRTQANEAIQRRISAKNLVITVVGTAKLIQGPLAEAIPNLASQEIVRFDDLE